MCGRDGSGRGLSGGVWRNFNVKLGWWNDLFAVSDLIGDRHLRFNDGIIEILRHSSAAVIKSSCVALTPPTVNKE